MEPRTLFIGVLAVTMINGMISPFTTILAGTWPIWLPGFFEPTPETIFYGAAMLSALASLILSGVPAALYERFRGLQETDSDSMMIWLGAAILLAIPGFV